MDLHVYGLDPVTLNAGLMKPRRGFTLVAGEEKLGVGKFGFMLDNRIGFAKIFKKSSQEGYRWIAE